MRLSSIVTLCAVIVFATLLIAQTTPPTQTTGPAQTRTPTPDKTAAEMPQSAGCPMGMGRGMRMRGGQGMGKGMRNGMGGNMADHRTIHALMADHAAVRRNVTPLSNGVRTETTSEDPQVSAEIRTHVRDMVTRLQKGQPIRMFDPLFREVFANASKIELKVEDIPGGVRVTETTKDPAVLLLIRQHAQAVDGFVAEGMAQMHESHPLPDGYKRDK